MTKGKTLQDRLAASLDQANRREAKAKKKKQAPKGGAMLAAVRVQTSPKLPSVRRCTKLSVSLFDGDLARLEAIRDYMAERGHRLSTSQTVKLALRTAPLTPDMDKALEAIRSEDGRKW